MEERVYITEEFKKELQNLVGTYIDYITVYKKESDKVFFKIGRNKFHVSQTEFEAAKLA